MKINTFPVAALLATALLLTACGGYRYLDAPPLPFHEIDYGFPTKTALADPHVAYIDQGSGEQTIILVHGLASNAGFWRYNIPELARTHRVIAVDLPGYGKSGKGDYPYGMTWYAETIKNLIAELDLRNVTYIGHSMGGQIGITLALEHPSAIDRLVLAAPAGIERFGQGQGHWLRNALTMTGVRTNTEEAVRRNLSMNFYRWNPQWEWMVEERVRMAKDEEMKEFAYTVIQSVGAMLDEPTTDRLGGVSVPTLIVYGRFDGLIPNPYLNPGHAADVFRAGHEAIAGSRLVELDRAGHMLQIEQPGAFNRAVLEFLNR